MKTKNLFFMFLFVFAIITGLIVFNSCEKERQPIDADIEIEASDEPLLSNEVRNLVIDELAKVVALSVNEKDVRKMFQNELSKQFTLDYDILYRFIADKEVNSKYGKIKYLELLHKLANEHNLSLVNLDNNSEIFKNLQVSAPAYFEDWQPENLAPDVIALPVEYTENKGIQVRSYNSNGESVLVREEEVKQPFLLVRESERVDPTGFIRIDINNLVLPTGYRTLTAEEAYEIADLDNGTFLKSTARSNNSPLIERIPDNSFTQPFFTDTTQIIENFLSKNPSNIVNKENINQLKATCSSYPNPPTTVEVFPSYPYQIYIKWGGLTGDVNLIEIYRKYSKITFVTYWPFIISEQIFEKIASLDPYTQGGNSYYDKNLSSGRNYEYQIGVVNSEGCRSALSYPLDAYASWRNKNVNEKIKKIYIDNTCWNWCCGLFDGKIELVCIPVYYDKKNSSISFPKKSLTRKTKNEQKGKWCDYNNILFQWDMSRHAYNYLLSMYEDETGGNDQGVKITVGGEFKVSDSAKITGSISYTIDNRDEEMGYFEVYYYHSSDNEYLLQPKKGSAKVIVGQ